MEYNTGMSTRVEAIYENGILRPVAPLPFAEHEHVTITIDPLDDDIDHQYIAECRARVAGLDHVPTIFEIQERWKDVPGSFSDAILEARGDR